MCHAHARVGMLVLAVHGSHAHEYEGMAPKISAVSVGSAVRCQSAVLRLQQSLALSICKSQAVKHMKTYRAAVIGRTGRGDYGHGLDEVWNDLPNVEVVAVSDDDKMGLAKTAAKLKVDKAFPDYREMLDKVKPDLVSIATRWLDQHRDMVVACAERGIHMYMEKPFCRTLSEADEMVAACERTHTKLAIAHQTRYSPKLPVVKEILASGKIGRLLEIRGRGKEDATRG